MNVPNQPKSDPRLLQLEQAIIDAEPFASNRVGRTDTTGVDIGLLHSKQFEQLFNAINRVRKRNNSCGVLLLGESGSGKSNMLDRLRRWARNSDVCRTVDLTTTQVPPEQIHLAMARDLTCALTFSQELYDTRLCKLGLQFSHNLYHKTGNKVDRMSFATELIDRMGLTGYVPPDHAVLQNLFSFCNLVYTDHLRKDPALSQNARRVLNWFCGQVDPANASAARLDFHSTILYFAVIAQLHRTIEDRALVLLIDQIHSLQRQQITALAKWLHELIDTARNLIVITSDLTEEMQRLRNAQLISPAAWDRISGETIEMGRFNHEQIHMLYVERLKPVLQPFTNVPEVEHHLRSDPLFPLGSMWFKQRFAELPEARPRQAIQIAHERWNEVIGRLRNLGVVGWLASWPGDEPPLVDKVVNRTVRAWIEKLLVQPPNADTLRDALACLLAPMLDPLTVGALTSVVSPTNGKPDPFSLLLTYRLPADAAKNTATLGVLCLLTDAAHTTTAHLRRLAELAHQPSEILILTEERLPLCLGKLPASRAQEFLQALQQSMGDSFSVRELTRTEYVDLVALAHVMRHANTLKLNLPDGSTRSLTEQEVHDCYQRAGWFTSHWLLNRLVKRIF